jgi:hypothetical protein
VKPDPNVLYVVRKKLNDDKGNAQLLPGQCWGRKNAGRKVELDGEAIQARFCEIINRRIEEVTEVLQEKIDELEHGGGPVLEVKRIRFEMEATQDWDALENNLQKLIPYAREFGLVVKHEVLDAVSVATDRTRQGMPVHVAQAAEYVLSELMPVGWGGMLHPARKKVSDDDQKLLERIEHITFDITWDACRYLRDLGVVKVGAERYWALIRFATLNGLQRLQGLLLENARRCRDMCNEERGRGTFPEGWAAMDDEIEDALNLPEHSNRSVPPT